MERNAAGLTEAEFLANYNPGDYERPSVTVDMMVLRVKQDFSCLQILLIIEKRPSIHQLFCSARVYLYLPEAI